MSDRDERAARLAAQLRANLRRRKDRDRAQAADAVTAPIEPINEVPDDPA